jgi:hypothetical protein
MSNEPPPEVAAAAAVVDNWLKSAPQSPVSDEQYKAMTPAQKLDYARRFDQTKFLPDGRRQG